MFMESNTAVRGVPFGGARMLFYSSYPHKLQGVVPVVAGHLEKLAGCRGFDVNYSSSPPIFFTATPSSLARSPYPSSTAPPSCP